MSKKQEFETRTVKWVAVRNGASLFDESATEVEIEDEMAGEFVTLTQHHGGGDKVSITPEEWPILRAVIDNAIKMCRPSKAEQAAAMAKKTQEGKAD